MQKLYADWNAQNVVSRDHSLCSVKPVGNKHNEFVFQFSEPNRLSGRIESFSSPSMEVALMNLELKTNVVFSVNDGVERLGATYVQNGLIQSDCLYDEKYQKLNHGQHMLVYSLNDQVSYTLKPGTVELFNMNIKPAFFTELFDQDEVLHAMFRGNRPHDYCVGAHLGGQSANVYQSVVDAIRWNPFTGITKQLFIEAKATELFLLELHELLSKRKVKIDDEPRKADREKLMAVYDFIQQNYTETFSLRDLALQFGLNDFKLKKGYKLLFDTTVFGHVHRLRMQQAKALLQSGEHPITEVAYLIGYSSPNNFSTAFGRLFGVSPRDFLKGRLG